MIRTLVILAAVSFVLAVVCFAAAFAIVGGPFYIDDDGQFHRTGWAEVSVVRHQVLPTPARPS
jgi:hypothetical protein